MNFNGESQELSDALVLFGITGDLAYRKIFSALHTVTKRSELNLFVIGVASSP